MGEGEGGRESAVMDMERYEREHHIGFQCHAFIFHADQSAKVRVAGGPDREARGGIIGWVEGEGRSREYYPALLLGGKMRKFGLA